VEKGRFRGRRRGGKGGRKEGRKRKEVCERSEMVTYEVRVGRWNCKENGGISLSTVERWSPSKNCRPEVVAL
jgi:hypothetical protein